MTAVTRPVGVETCGLVGDPRRLLPLPPPVLSQDPVQGLELRGCGAPASLSSVAGSDTPPPPPALAELLPTIPKL